MEEIIISKSLLKYFGLTGTQLYYSRTIEDRKEDLKEAILENQMLALVGESGTGKSYLFDFALSEISEEVKFVYVRNFYKENLNIGSIINAVLYDLEESDIRRDLEARSRQFTRVVGKQVIDNNKKVCIVLEEGHRFHVNTIRALKELREIKYANKGPLCSIILIGHPELTTKLKSCKEAYWRSHNITLNEANGWYEKAERIKFLKVVFKDAITEEARKRIASLNYSPLEMKFYVREKMIEAKKAGKHILDEEVVQPTTRELYENLKRIDPEISMQAIADEATGAGTRISKSQVFNAIQSGETHPKNDAVKAALERLQNQIQKQARKSA